MDFSVSTVVAAFLALLLWVDSSTGQADRAPPYVLGGEEADDREQNLLTGREEKTTSYAKRAVRIAGSRLPDCSHACGSCSPCKLVTVGSACGRGRPIESESCPISYRCMCRNKLYPVP